MMKEDAHAFNEVVSGALYVYSAYSCALFDSGGTHSFVSSIFIQKLVLTISAIDYDLCVATPLEVNIVLDRACTNCLILIVSHELLAQFHYMNMKNNDVIFGNGFSI